MLETERHNQLAWLSAQSTAVHMSKAGSTKLQKDLQSQINRASQLSLLDLSGLLEKKTARGSVDDLVKIYTMLEDKLNAIGAADKV